MAQPVWKVIQETDDSLVTVDETGEYEPEMEIAQEYENDRGRTRFDVYRFALEKLHAVKVQGPSSSMRPLLAVASTGDPDAIEVVRDWLEERLGWRPSESYTMKFVRDPPVTRTYLVSAGWDPSWTDSPVHSYEIWFADKLQGIANSIGSSRDALVRAFTSDDPLERAWAYRAIGDVEGFDNLDADPLRGLTEKQLEQRWKKK